MAGVTGPGAVELWTLVAGIAGWRLVAVLIGWLVHRGAEHEGHALSLARRSPLSEQQLATRFSCTVSPCSGLLWISPSAAR